MRIRQSPGHERVLIKVFFLVAAMLATALPKLVNLQEIQFVGSNIVWNKLAELIVATHPRLQGLTFKYVSLKFKL